MHFRLLAPFVVILVLACNAPAQAADPSDAPSLRSKLSQKIRKILNRNPARILQSLHKVSNGIGFGSMEQRQDNHDLVEDIALGILKGRMDDIEDGIRARAEKISRINDELRRLGEEKAKLVAILARYPDFGAHPNDVEPITGRTFGQLLADLARIDTEISTASNIQNLDYGELSARLERYDSLKVALAKLRKHSRIN